MTTAEQPDDGPVVTVFRSRRRDDHADEYARTATRMQELAQTVPGYLDFKTFTADDGEHVSIVVFASAEAQAAWRDHPEHRSAQDAGRDRFYESYDVRICREISRRTFAR